MVYQRGGHDKKWNHNKKGICAIKTETVEEKTLLTGTPATAYQLQLLKY